MGMGYGRLFEAAGIGRCLRKEIQTYILHTGSNGTTASAILDRTWLSLGRSVEQVKLQVTGTLFTKVLTNPAKATLHHRASSENINA